MRWARCGSVVAHFSIGVEEEFHIADPISRLLTSDAGVVLNAISRDARFAGGQFQSELHTSMLETSTTVCSTLREVRQQLTALRSALDRAARACGRRVAASGTVPLAATEELQITPDTRYRRIEGVHQQVARRMMACGMHVHIGFTDRDEAVQVMNRTRVWLAPLLALTANSPFWSGRDTGFASYRSVTWGRWPSAAIPESFSDAAEYDAVARVLVASGALVDVGQVYWDLRLSNHQPTLEFRIADVCMTVDEAVLQAGLCRALARTCRDETLAGRPVPTIRPELLRAAKWRAARYGLEDALFDPLEAQLVPAGRLIHKLLAYLQPALHAEGDWDEICSLAEQSLERGSGAARQRSAFARAGRLHDVVDLVIRETTSGT